MLNLLNHIGKMQKCFKWLKIDLICDFRHFRYLRAYFGHQKTLEKRGGGLYLNYLNGLNYLNLLNYLNGLNLLNGLNYLNDKTNNDNKNIT